MVPVFLGLGPPSPSSKRISLTPASVITSPSLTLSFFSPSYKDSVINYTGPTWVVQDTFPIAKVLNQTHLQNPFCLKMEHSQVLMIWMQIYRGIIIHYSTYYNFTLNCFFSCHSLTWFGIPAEITGLLTHIIHVLVCFRISLDISVLGSGGFWVSLPHRMAHLRICQVGLLGPSSTTTRKQILSVPYLVTHLILPISVHSASRLQSAGISAGRLPWPWSLFSLCLAQAGNTAEISIPIPQQPWLMNGASVEPAPSFVYCNLFYWDMIHITLNSY